MKKIVCLVLFIFAVIGVSGCHSHKWVSATCTEPKKCYTCGATEGVALGHAIVKATCAEPEHCARCDECTKKTTLGHELTYEITVKPTCQTEGVQEGTCKNCGAVITNSIAKSSHKFDEENMTIVEEPTCSKAGTKTSNCTVCGKEMTKSIEKLPHEYGEWYIEKEATCTENGMKASVCVVCGYQQTELIKKIDHNISDYVVTKESTCQSKGTKTATCYSCGKEFTEAIPYADHTPAEHWTMYVTPRSASDTGKQGILCNVCGEVMESQSIKLSLEEINAANRALQYLKTMPFSSDSLKGQLVFEGYPSETASKIVNLLDVNWKEQAYLKGKSYLNMMSFSRQGLIDQLMFEGYSWTEAEYAVKKLGYDD